MKKEIPALCGIYVIWGLSWQHKAAGQGGRYGEYSNDVRTA